MNQPIDTCELNYGYIGFGWVDDLSFFAKITLIKKLFGFVKPNYVYTSAKERLQCAFRYNHRPQFKDNSGITASYQ